MTEGRVGDMTDQVTKAALSATTRANAAWDKLEQVFQDRVARSLKSLGVPTTTEINALHAKITELGAAVTALKARKSTTTPSTTTAVKKTSTRKTAAKKVAAKAK